MYRALLFYVNILLLSQQSFATSFDCKNAVHPIEISICSDKTLSELDEVMVRKYQNLLASCDLYKINIRKQQQTWLHNIRQTALKENVTNEWLQQQYLKQNDQLNNFISQCNSPKFDSIQIRTIESNALHYKMPFIITNIPEIGQKINNIIFNDIFDTNAPSNFNEGFKNIMSDTDTEGISRSITYTDYSIIHKEKNLLILEISGEGCGAYCSNYTNQYIFDLRTGRRVKPEDLVTDQGYKTLTTKLKAQQIQKANQKVSQMQKKGLLDKEEFFMYKQCIKEWTAWQYELWSLNLDQDKRWRFKGFTCSNHANAMFDALDNLDLVLSSNAFKQYLNAYGKSLLLRQGEVYSPTDITFSCPVNQLKFTNNTIQADDIKEVSIGTGQILLLQNNGQLWAWGTNNNGELGIGRTNIDRVTTPSLVGTNFQHIATGQVYSAGLRNDGTLWTWGSGYAGRLGYKTDAVVTIKYPVQILKDIRSIDANSGEGLALHQNGSLWAWGGERDIHKIADNVTQIGYGYRGNILTIKEDGSLWENQTKIGEGFSKLAVRGAALAYKKDGSLWAWGETLAALDDTEGRLDIPPRKIGDGFLKVVADDHGKFIVGLKYDGSLWASHKRGGLQWLNPVGCNYSDISIMGSMDNSEEYDIHALAIKNDGTLVAWGNWQLTKEWEPMIDLFAKNSQIIGKNFLKLYKANSQFGDFTRIVVIKDTNNSVWEWSPTSEKYIPIPLRKVLTLNIKDFK